MAFKIKLLEEYIVTKTDTIQGANKPFRVNYYIMYKIFGLVFIPIKFKHIIINWQV